jgi:hypothetical protein
MNIVTDYIYEKTAHKALFDLICDPINWKNPIDCYIPEHAFEKFNEACVYFTGASLVKTTIGHYDGRGGKLINCRSEGYYNTIGT